jgi:hypothetical protein
MGSGLGIGIHARCNAGHYILFQEQPSSCFIFKIFSVNTAGQFRKEKVKRCNSYSCLCLQMQIRGGPQAFSLSLVCMGRNRQDVGGEAPV